MSPGQGGLQIAGHVPGPQPVSGGRRGGKIVAGYNGAPVSYDPALGSAAQADWDGITQLVSFGGWFALDGDTGAPIPNLAEAMPEISQDGTTLTIRFRSGVKFHNGREIQAEDYKYSLERMMGLPTSWGPSYYSGIVGYDAIISGKSTTFEGLEVKDAHTLALHLSQPQATILDILCLPFAAPVPQEEVERWGKDFGKHAVSFGPYKLETFDQSGQRAVFSRFDDYFYEGLPYLDEIEQRWGLNTDLMLQEIKGGQLDMTGEGSPSFLREAAGQPDLQQYIVKAPQLAQTWIKLFTNHPPLDDANVRQALNWGIDRSQIAKFTLGSETGSGTPFPETMGVPYPGEPYGFDLDKARQLLAAGGVPDGFSATLAFTSDQSAMAQFVQQQLAAIGVKLTLDTMSGGALSDVFSSAGVDMGIVVWNSDYPDPSEIIDFNFANREGHVGSIVDHRVDDLEQQALVEYDQEKRLAIYAQIEQLAMDDASNVWLATQLYIGATGPQVQNYHYRGETGSYYDRLWVTS